MAKKKKKERTEFVVTDHEGNISYNPDKEEAESFTKFSVAEKRAQDMARSFPGERIAIYELCAEVIVPTGGVETRHK